jgi:GTP-binding protein HflX
MKTAEEIKKLLSASLKRDINNEAFISDEFIKELVSSSVRIHKGISVFLTRKKQIVDVLVDESMNTLPVLGGKDALSKIFCITTRLGKDSNVSGVDLATLKNLKLDFFAVLSISKDGRPKDMQIAFLSGERLDRFEIIGPYPYEYFYTFDFLGKVSEIEKKSKTNVYNTGLEKEKVVLVDVRCGRDKGLEDYLFEELERLTDTAGGEVIYKVIQRRDTPDPKYYIGNGKINELASIVQRFSGNLVVFNGELSPSQIANLESALGVRVIDRTDLILDIFAKHAQSREGKLQVELAQLKHMLPRLTGKGKELSRLGGGIGTRGPGERKLEVDRRHILNRISLLERELEDVKRHRALVRHARERNNIPVVSLVGYTNAGKSTLMNTLTHSDLFVADKLFATLDPTTRLLWLDELKVLLTDTVGFIHKLPHHLVEAFSATLEEIRYGDLILHIIDASDPFCYEHIKVVDDMLTKLGIIDKPVIRVYNKIDLIDTNGFIPFTDGINVFISALTGENIEELKRIIKEEILKIKVEGAYVKVGDKDT